ncbi:MAG: flippase-like domain-containing protein [Planctomycetes bacterium]|nr:flippase-like domain-containing protein [Planctomycetota bacterium]
MSKYIRIAISALLLTVIAWRTDWSVVGDKFANLNVWLWAAAAGVLVLGQFLSARRWQLFARELRFERSLSQYFAYYLIGMWFNLSLPTSVGGDVVRVWYLDGKTGRKLAAFASVFLERINGLLVLIAVACVGVLASPIALPGWISLAVWSVAGGAVLGMASLPIVQRWIRLPPQRREQLGTMFELLRHPRVITEATVMSILVQLIGVVSVGLIGMALGLDIPFAYYAILGPMVSLLTLLPISVNGMGVREVGTVVFLAPLGIHEDSAKTLAFLWFAVQVAVSLLGGLVYLFGAYPKAEMTADPAKDGNDGPVDRDSDQGREGQHQKAA